MTIKEGQKPSEIAKKFKVKYGLDRITEKILEALLIKEMQK